MKARRWLRRTSTFIKVKSCRIVTMPNIIGLVSEKEIREAFSKNTWDQFVLILMIVQKCHNRIFLSYLQVKFNFDFILLWV